MGTEIRQWIEIDPLDTLFFRGSDPMVAGESHEVRTIFPPMPSTIIGALRTAILVQRKVALTRFVNHEGESPADPNLPLLGSVSKPGFSIAGPLIEIALEDGTKETLYPAPANWFGQKNDTKDTAESMDVCAAVYGLQDIASVGLAGNGPLPLWVEAPKSSEMKSLNGFWTNAATINAMAPGNCNLPVLDDLSEMRAGKPVLIRSEALFSREQRTGIALDLGARRALRGHLYTSTHVRLAKRATLLIGLSAALIPSHIDEEGVLQLGGEQRFSQYRVRQTPVTLPLSATGWVLSLNPISFEALNQCQLDDKPRASGPLLRMAGWDMKNSFHKATTAYLPMGTAIKIGDATADIPFGFVAI